MGFESEFGEIPVAIVYGDFEAYLFIVDPLFGFPSTPLFSSSTGTMELYRRLLAPNMPPPTIGPFLP